MEVHSNGYSWNQNDLIRFSQDLETYALLNSEQYYFWFKNVTDGNLSEENNVIKELEIKI